MITFDEAQIKRATLLLSTIPGGVEKAAAGALNRAAESARTAAVRKVREEYIVTAKRVRNSMRVTKANTSSLLASVTSKGGVMALSYFKIHPKKVSAKRPKNPLFAQVKRDGGGTIEGAFVARVRSGHLGVFNRLGKDSLPITQRYGPSVPQMLGGQSISAHVEKEATMQLEKRLDHEIGRLLKG